MWNHCSRRLSELKEAIIVSTSVSSSWWEDLGLRRENSQPFATPITTFFSFLEVANKQGFSSRHPKITVQLFSDPLYIFVTIYKTNFTLQVCSRVISKQPADVNCCLSGFVSYKCILISDLESKRMLVDKSPEHPRSAGCKNRNNLFPSTSPKFPPQDQGLSRNMLSLRSPALWPTINNNRSTSEF